MTRSSRAHLLAAVAVSACAWRISAAPQRPIDVSALVAHVGERVIDYYRRAESLVCLETSTVQPVSSNWTPEGMARRVQSELRVETEATDGEALPEPRIVRTILSINGRAPRERDKKDRSGCTDPNPLSPEPLAFLLPAHRGEYRFTAIHAGKEQGRAALIVDFMSANRTSRPELVEDARGHADCFDWTGPVAARGRVWVDVETHDVLRVERHIDGPVDVRVSWALQRRYLFGPRVTLDRDDVTLRYKAVRFADPDEIILLPASIDAMTVLRGGLQSIRRTDTFADYRRFLTKGRVIGP